MSPAPDPHGRTVRPAHRFVVLEPDHDAGADERAALLDATLAEVDAQVVPVLGWADAWPAATPLLRGAEVASPDDAARAVLAAVRGEDLVLVAVAEREVVDRMCDDLRRLGSLDHRLGAAPPPRLAPDERALLAHLVAGDTLGAAARALHISRRTADRRLAAARAALGARSTAEAVAQAARLGLTPRD